VRVLVFLGVALAIGRMPIRIFEDFAYLGYIGVLVLLIAVELLGFVGGPLHQIPDGTAADPDRQGLGFETAAAARAAHRRVRGRFIGLVGDGHAAKPGREQRQGEFRQLHEAS
jgi:hypothetical protein